MKTQMKCCIGSVLFARKNQSSKKEIQYFLEIITCEPSLYTMDHPDFIVCSFMEKPIGLKKVKPFTNCMFIYCIV